MSNSQAALPEYSGQLEGRVVLLEARRGEQRRGVLEGWLARAHKNGASGWLTSCDFEKGGPWAGLDALFQGWLPSLGSEAPELLRQHDFELVSILPSLRRTLNPRNPTLTDLAQEAEQVRLYPADRALRILHGLIDLIASWKRSCSPEPWVLVCDDFDAGGYLVRRFFRELMRRRGADLSLTLLAACEPGQAEPLSAFLSPVPSRVAGTDCQPDPSSTPSPQEMSRLAEALEARACESPEDRESCLPGLIYHWLRSDAPERALPWQYEAFSIFTSRGFYEDAVSYGTAALAHLDRACPDDTRRRWKLVNKLFACHCTRGYPEEALDLVTATLDQLKEPYFRALAHYVLSMLHARYLPVKDLRRAERHLEQGLVELEQSDLPPHELHFQIAFNQNGLALIRFLQGRHQEAIDLCRAGHERLSAHLGEDQHQLHKSVLLYNIAQVYSAVGAHEESIRHLTLAMSMDPNYSEYYNERGNAFFKQGRYSEALSDYRQAISLSPPFPEVHANLGHCCRHLQDFEAAVEAYNRCLDLNPTQLPIFIARAECFEALGREQEALEDYDRALGMEPRQPLVLANRASLRYGVGDLAGSLADLQQAIGLDPENPELYQNRAIALSDLGHSEEAAQDLERYLQLSPPTAEDREAVASRLVALRR